MAGTACQKSCGTEPGLQGHCIPFYLYYPSYETATLPPMKKQLTRVINFLTVGIWHVKRQDVSPWLYFLYGVVKKLLLAVERATTKRMVDAASALTYSTLLAIVPIMAVVFAIARGFGYNKYIEDWFRDALASQPQAADVIVGFVNSYLVHTKSGIFLGVGLIFMLWTVIMLINNIEQTFNYIWQVKKPRSLFRTITDYMAMFLLVPIIIVITSGVSIFVATVSDSIEGYALLAPVMRFIIALMPYLFMSAVFIALYLFMPNTKSQAGVCHCARHTCRRCNAGSATCLHPFTDLGEQLQRHLWFVCRLATVYVVGADFMDHMPVRCRTLLYEPKP